MTFFQKPICAMLLACLFPASIATAQSVAEKQAQQPIPSGGNFLGMGLDAFLRTSGSSDRPLPVGTRSAVFFGASINRLSGAQANSPIAQRSYTPLIYLGYGWRM